jgi:hypothetical protein
MTVTTVDIANRALVLIGLSKKLSSLTQDSAEAQAINTVITPILKWCFGIANWNFARTTAALTSSKGPPGTNPGNWTTAEPSPPWLYEYTLPADFIRAIYVTNFSSAATGPGWAGEPQRFVIANDGSAPVLLTNQATAALIYTANVSDPTNWPWYFERLAVIAVAHGVATTLTRNFQLTDNIAGMLEQQISIGTQINQIEGLTIGDNTPEWIQALGINYPYSRINTADQVTASPLDRRRAAMPKGQTS